jgi:hypothetical protein
VKLEVQLDRERYSPGDTVSGTVLVLEGGASRKLEVSLEFREEAEDGYEDTPLRVPGGELHASDLAMGASYQFAIALPADALPNLKTEHGKLWWEVDARSDERGRDTHERKTFAVLTQPRAEE